MPTNLTPHFTLEELTFSQLAARKGIDNSATPEIVKNLKRLASTLEEIRALLGNKVIIVSSAYRSPQVNTLIGGSATSAHQFGLAVDFTSPQFGSVYDIAKKIAGSKIEYDQLIFEFNSWVHVGLAADGKTPRRQALSIFKSGNYLPGILPPPGSPAPATSATPASSSTTADPAILAMFKQ